jgi:hypothetical protein
MQNQLSKVVSNSNIFMDLIVFYLEDFLFLERLVIVKQKFKDTVVTLNVLFVNLM